MPLLKNIQCPACKKETEHKYEPALMGWQCTECRHPGTPPKAKPGK